MSIEIRSSVIIHAQGEEDKEPSVLLSIERRHLLIIRIFIAFAEFRRLDY